MLEAKEVNFAYLRGQPVLNDIDIKIESGEFVALLGHNGSGKTTLSRLFMALIHPRSGQVLVDGTDIAAMEPADLADKIGYAFQNPDLQILEDTVFDEVAYGPRAKKLSEDKVKRQVETALAAAIQNISMVLRLVPLVLVIVLGIFAGKSQPDLSLATAFTTDTPPTFFNIVKVIGYATFASLWAYEGWTNLNTVAGEMKRPKRDLPLAIIISMGGIMLIYTLFNFAVYRIIPQAEVNSMIADGNIYLGKTAAFNVMGNFGKWIVLIGMAVGIVGTVNGDCLVFPRTYYAMARGGFFFKKCGEVNDKGVPAFAIIASSAMSIILVLFNSLQQLTDWLVTVSALLNLMAIFAVLIFRKKYPDMERPYKVWGGIPVIILTCLLFVVLLVNNFVEDPLTSAKGLIIIALCIPFYYIFRKLNGGMEYDTDKIDN